jgi:hypothetical protein
MRLAFDRVREWRLPAAERNAAREERRAEQAIRRERDNQHRAEGRAAALESEARRHSNYFGPGGGGNIGGPG